MDVNRDTRTGSRNPSLSFAQLRELMSAHRDRVVALCALVAAATCFHHWFMPTYVAQSTLIFQTADNSPLQAGFSQVSPGASSVLLEKTNEQLEKYFAFMKTHEYHLRLAQALRERKDAPPAVERLSRLRGPIGHVLRRLILEPRDSGTREDRLAQALEEIVGVKKSAADNLILRVKGSDGKFAVEVANLIAEASVDVITREDLRDLAEAREYIQGQMQAISDRIKEIDGQLVEFKRKNNVLSTDLIRTDLGTSVSQMQRDLNESRIKLDENRKLIRLITTEIKSQEQALFAHGSKALESNDLASKLRQRIEALKYKKSLLESQGYGPDSWQMNEVNQEIDRTVASLKPLAARDDAAVAAGATVVEPLFDNKESRVKRLQDLRKENHFLEARVSSLTASIADFRRSFTFLPAGEQHVNDLRRRSEIEFSLLQEMRKKFLQIEVQEISLKSRVRILEKASTAGLAPRPTLAVKLLLALLLSLLAAGLAVFAYDELRDTIKDRREITRLGLEVAGGLPRFARSWKAAVLAPWGRDSEAYTSITRAPEDAPESMALALLARQITGRSWAPGPRTISVASDRAGEGKSFISSNLAHALAAQGHRVLILDCDYRRRTLSRAFGMLEAQSARDPLSDRDPLPHARRFVYSLAPRLDMIPAGRFIRGSGQLTNRERLRRLVNTMAGHYDYVLVDTPALRTGPDALIVAAETRMTLFVVSYMRSEREGFAEAARKIREVSPGSVWAVFNEVSLHREYAEICLKEGAGDGGEGGADGGADGKKTVRRIA
jgi:polysaccharide biosynthesis transport protein